MPCEGTPVGHCMHSDLSICCFPDVFGPPDWPPVDTWHRDRCFVGFGTEFEYGQYDMVGCGLGCAQCPDWPDDLVKAGDTSEGQRWLAPHPRMPARDAYGYLHDLQAGQIWPVPQTVNYLRGTCLDNFGLECFGSNVCYCYGDNQEADTTPVQVGDQSQCPFGVDVLDPVVGLYPDQFASIGMGWRLDPVVGFSTITRDQQYCRMFQDSLNGAPNHHIHAAAEIYDGMLLPVFIRTVLHDGPHKRGHCTSNALIVCTARVEQGPYECNGFGWGHYFGDEWIEPPDYYNSDESRQRYAEIRLLSNSIGLATEGETIQAADKPTLEARNTVLELVRQNPFVNPSMDRLDSEHVQAGNNAYLNNWSREWVAPSWEDSPIVEGMLDRCYMLYAGNPVDVQVRVSRVRYAMNLVMQHMIDMPSTSHESHRVVPHARVRVVVHLRWRAICFGACRLIQRWLPEDHPDYIIDLAIRNPSTDNELPRVEPDVDTIIYQDVAGNVIRPFASVEWWGFLGRHSMPNIFHVDRPVDATTTPTYCTQVADALTDLEIPAWPYRAQSMPEDPASMYTGRLRVSFAP